MYAHSEGVYVVYEWSSKDYFKLTSPIYGWTSSRLLHDRRQGHRVSADTTLDPGGDEVRER